jgi:hypothetical protein
MTTRRNRGLLFIGKVRNGLTPWLRKELHKKLEPFETCPFAICRNEKHGLEPVTKEEMKNCRWVKPELVGQIGFSEWTVDNHLRHPEFMVYGGQRPVRSCSGNPELVMGLAAPVLIGTAGYSYPGPSPKGWYGAFYPDTKPKEFDELKSYSQIFNTVEINSTFYRPPSQATTKNWSTKTPDDFQFAIKLWQKFTHPMKISSRKKSDEQWEGATDKDFDEFRTGILPLADSGKLGALLLQYPTGFHCTPENLAELQATLRWFYDYPKAVKCGTKAGVSTPVN